MPSKPDAIAKGDRLFLVDGSAYIFRAYHALPPLTRKSDGLPIGAVSGFSNMLFKLLADSRDDDFTDLPMPTHFAVIFDHSAYSFRNDLYADYKANRPEPPEDLRPQFPLVREATRAFSVACVEMEGFEADDLIATYARRAEEAGAETVIISSDKDLMQLVSDRIVMYDPMKQKRIDADGVREKFGVGPDKVVDVQALAGDSVDNVPGVPGIGVKTAAQLIEDYGDVETLLERAEEIKQKKRRENLIEFADDARISKQLVTLKDDVETEENLGDFRLKEVEPTGLLDFIDAMEFNTLRRRAVSAFGEGESAAIGPAAAANGPVEAGAYETVYDPVRLREIVDICTARGVVAFDTETNSLRPVSAKLVGLCLAWGAGEACYVPLGHGGDGLALDDKNAGRQMAEDDALAIVKPLLEDPSVLKIAQNAKFDMGLFLRRDIRVAPVDDTMLISYALDCGVHGHGMDELSELHLGHKPIAFSEIAGTGKKQKTFDEIPIDEASKYAAEDADVTLRLHQVLKPRLSAEGMRTVYETLERPMAAVIAGMEMAGVKVDASVLRRLSGEFAQKMGGYEAAAYEAAGREFNMGSPKQISEILFSDLGLPGGKKTAKGAWSTKADILEQLAAEGHALPRAILDWRGLSKLKSTYTDALVEDICQETGRVHTSYSLAATTTGRLSSNDPNLQNIPIRTEDGRRIRDAFIAEEGNVLISADYSQIELRILAHVAEIEPMRQAFADDLDIHAMTASEMFDTPIEGMDPMVRRQAKAINFGIIYGISAFGLANNLGIPRGEAQDYIHAYFEKFPGIRKYMDETKAYAREHGHVSTIFGRKTHTPKIKASNQAERGYAERQAINAPIQGAAADIIRRAMIRMPDALEAKKLSAKMLLQVHDELIFEAPEDEAEETCAVVSDVMSGAAGPAVEISVPLKVEAGVGANWGEAH
ncbi:MAG: DNA polymerase I [Pseudomonadota bacterium]